MATMRENRPDSDIYEDTVVMPVSGTIGPQASDALYEPLRIEEGKLSQVQTATTRRETCGKRRWWAAGAVAVALLCIGLALAMGWVAGTAWSSNKQDKVAENQETTLQPDALQEHLENVIESKFKEIQRAIEGKMTHNATEDKNTNIEDKLQSRLIELENEMGTLKKMMTESEKELKAIKTEQAEIENKTGNLEKEATIILKNVESKFEQIKNTTNNQISAIRNGLQPRLTELEKEMTSVQIEQSATDAKCSSLDEAKVTIQTRLTTIEDKTEHQEKRVANTLKNLQAKCEQIGNTTDNKISAIQNGLQPRLTELEKEMTSVQMEQSATDAKCSSLDEAKVTIQTRLTTIEGIQLKKMAAFSVYPSSDPSLAKGAVVPFNRIIIDSMGGFDTNQHQYTCKITGIYYFSLCINNGGLGGGNSAHSGMYLEVGGNKILAVYSYNNDADHSTRDQACNAAVYKCSAGSTVRVKCNHDSRIWGTNNQPISILSGFLIYPQ